MCGEVKYRDSEGEHTAHPQHAQDFAAFVKWMGGKVLEVQVCNLESEQPATEDPVKDRVAG